ncbi:DUF998 domain-containing protein [Demequina oxidasica]|uniref:DUF998 domain-containing protein n=1 Tax=Demequina oxidasica TaxID=676199 RepID=UPI000781A6D8|nr:DUF998 domain-containing protein [Demequina oxidasica]
MQATNSHRRAPLSTSTLGAIAITGAAVWIATVAAFHLIRPDLSPGNAYISNYARGDWAWVMRLAFLINAAGWAAAGFGLRRSLTGIRGATVLATLAGIAALGMLTAGLFRADPLGTESHSIEGIVHSRAAGAAFIALILLGFVGWAAFRTADAWAGWAIPSLVFGSLAMALFATFTAWPMLVGDGFGWWQRTLAAVLIPGWLWALGTRLRRPAGSHAPMRRVQAGELAPTPSLAQPSSREPSSQRAS